MIKLFVDEITIKVCAGKGGDGCTSFHREKYLAMGGPDGGNGGRGANIIFEIDKGLKTLIDLRYQKIIKAPKGENGRGSNQFGANGEDVVIKVPEGTIVTDLANNEVIADLVGDIKKVIVAHGGRGGRGNAAFKTHQDNAPHFSELGEPGEEKTLKVELKLLADVGLIGYPSVGKSTILSCISASHPKIASYHFTTLSPNLGVVKLKDQSSFIIADLPGLIEGASTGVGLGHKFLRHAMRTKILAHVLDMGAEEERDPLQDYETIRHELSSYSASLAQKKEIIIANKMDLPNAQTNLAKFKKAYPNLEIIPVSFYEPDSYTNLINGLAKKLKEINNAEENTQTSISHVDYQFKEEKPFTITKDNNVWVLKGEALEKLFKMTRFTEDESVVRFSRKLKGMGVEDELLRLGAKYGDEVEICNYIFEFKE